MNGYTLTLADASKLCPGRPSTAALWRWARKGLLARNGTRHYLPHVRIGRQLYLSENGLAEFFSALAEADREALAGESTPHSQRSTSSRTEAQREQAIAAARRALEDNN